MRSASVAEWLVCRFIAKNRAISIVGDLVEVKPQKGWLWFWFSVLGLVASHTWRPLAAFLAALFAGYLAKMAVSVAISRTPLGFRHSIPMSPWLSVLAVLSICGIMAWMILLYTFIRYGFSDRLTQFTLVATVILSSAWCGWSQPRIVSTFCVLLIAAIVAVSIGRAKWRRPALTVFVSMLTGVCFFSLSGFIVVFYQHYAIRRGMGHRDLREYHSILLMVLFFTDLISIYAGTMVCSLMHRRMIEAEGPPLAE